MLDTFDPVILDCVHFLFFNLVLHDSNRTKEEPEGRIISQSRNWGPSGRTPCMYISFV